MASCLSDVLEEKLRYKLCNYHELRRLVAEGLLVIVSFDYSMNSSILIPENVLNLLVKYLESDSAD